jgi:hypothetical protein
LANILPKNLKVRRLAELKSGVEQVVTNLDCGDGAMRGSAFRVRIYGRMSPVIRKRRRRCALPAQSK